MIPKLMVPERFKDARLEHLDPDVFGMVQEYANSTLFNRGQGILLSGPPGVGKTFALAALTEWYNRRAKKPYYVFETTYTLLEKYAPVVPNKTTFNEARQEQWTDTYENARWLVINDLGKDYRGGKLSEQVISKVGRLLRARSENSRATFITTNLPLDRGDGSVRSFRDVYGESICSLVSEMMGTYMVDGPDRRARTGE